MGGINYGFTQEFKKDLRKALRYHKNATATFRFLPKENKVKVTVRDWEFKGESNLECVDCSGNVSVYLSVDEDNALIDFIIGANRIDTYKSNRNGLIIKNTDLTCSYHVEAVVFRNSKGKRMLHEEYVANDSRWTGMVNDD